MWEIGETRKELRQDYEALPGVEGRMLTRSRVTMFGDFNLQETTMTHRGKVKNGVVVLDDPKAIADGTDVIVEPVKSKSKPTRKANQPKSIGKD
jgi:hypothetical protein